MKKTKGDEPIGVVIHICMETTQRSSLCGYLNLKLAKRSCFSLHLFSSTKSENRSAEHVLLGVGGVFGTGGRGEVVGKGGRRMNTVQIMCTHVYKCKNDTCWNCSRNRGRGMKESGRRGEFKYDIFGAL
jgi:hypothetical protein